MKPVFRIYETGQKYLNRRNHAVIAASDFLCAASGQVQPMPHCTPRLFKGPINYSVTHNGQYVFAAKQATGQLLLTSFFQTGKLLPRHKQQFLITLTFPQPLSTALETLQSTFYRLMNQPSQHPCLSRWRTRGREDQTQIALAGIST